MTETAIPIANSPEETADVAPWLQLLDSRYLTSWLAEQQISLALTTYQTGKLFLVGRREDQNLSVFERTFSRSMGYWAATDARTLWMSSQYQLWRFENALTPGYLHQGYDCLYVPRAAFTTGDLDIHDGAVEDSGRLVFVATLFGCLATLNEHASFTPLWRPPFLSALVPEDRCHLNGLALRDGRPAFVTVVSRSDVADGLLEPAQDLVLTVGSAPAVRVRATNTTGSLATLYGWIDVNRDAVFDNATERTSVAVSTATNNGTFTLTFPTIPVSTAAGATYARFRLSTDVAAANSTGAATGGEVEDYAATITRRSDSTADSAKNVKLASGTNGSPTLANTDFFGTSAASLGDLDGDGVTDLSGELSRSVPMNSIYP